MIRVAMEMDACLRGPSGIGTYAWALGERLAAMPDVSFCGRAFNFAGRKDTAALDKAMQGKMQYSPLMAYGVYRRLWDAIPFRYASLFPGDVDVMHFTSHIVPPRVKGRVLLSVHDLTHLRYPETMQQSNLDFLRKEMARSVARADRIAVISAFTKRELITLMGVPEEKIRLIPCGIGERTPPAAFRPLASRLGITGRYILYLGTLEPRKNVLRLMEAYRRLRASLDESVQLVLAGAAGWKSEEIIAQAETTPGTILAGIISDAERTALFAEASAFAFPSLYEGFGIPVIEAMREGVPVVCADTASLPEVAGDAALLVNPLDEDSIAQGLYRVLTDKALAAGLVDKGRERVAGFQWGKAAQALRALYEEMVMV